MNNTTNISLADTCTALAPHGPTVSLLPCRYEIRDISPPAGVRAAMELQAEAERRKRAQILESEGTSQAKINVAEAKKQEQILGAEALQTEVVLVAEARKKEIVLAAEGDTELPLSENRGVKVRDM